MGGEHLSDGYYSRKESMCGQVTILATKNYKYVQRGAKKQTV